MKRREDVWLNNVSLRDVDPHIINIRLIEKTGQNELTFAQMAGKSGRLLLGRRMVSKKLSVEFMLRELYDLTARTAALEAVNVWAGGGGILLSSTRPERRIKLLPTAYGAAGDIRDYNAVYRVEFETGAIPYWESESPVIWDKTAASGSGTLFVSGNAPTWADVSVVSSSALTMVSVAVGNNFIHLNGINVAANTEIRIWHDDDGVLRINAGSASLMANRTQVSSDDLTGGPGSIPVSYEASESSHIAVSARGRWM